LAGGLYAEGCLLGAKRRKVCSRGGIPAVGRLAERRAPAASPQRMTPPASPLKRALTAPRRSMPMAPSAQRLSGPSAIRGLLNASVAYQSVIRDTVTVIQDTITKRHAARQ